MNQPPKRPGAIGTAVPRESGSLGAGATVLLAWLVPGAGHAVHGQAGKSIVFFLVLCLMYVLGLTFGGRLFPFQTADILVLLAASAEWASGAPRLVAAVMGAGEGRVVAATYEYGNAFLIASGLLNLLVVLDAFDLAKGRTYR